MSFEIPKPDSPEEHEYGHSTQELKSALIKKFNQIFPDKAFDNDKAIMQIDEGGNIKLVEKIGKVERYTGDPQFHPEEKRQEYTFDSEDLKKIFNKLGKETRENYIKGLEASVQESEKIIEKKPDIEGLTDEEKKELEKDREEEEEVMEATQKLIDNLK